MFSSPHQFCFGCISFCIGLGLVGCVTDAWADDELEECRGVEVSFTHDGRKIKVYSLERSSAGTVLAYFDPAPIGRLWVQTENPVQRFEIYLQRDFPDSQATVVETSSMKEKNSMYEAKSRLILTSTSEKIDPNGAKKVGDHFVLEQMGADGNKVVFYVNASTRTTDLIEFETRDAQNQFSISEITVKTDRFLFRMPKSSDFVVETKQDYNLAVEKAVWRSMPSQSKPDVLGIMKEHKVGGDETVTSSKLKEKVEEFLVRLYTFNGLEHFISHIQNSK